MPSSQYEKLARGALLEITTEQSIGALVGERVESDGIKSVLFASTLRGYPGWNWTVSIAHVSGSDPTVLEAELMPAAGALLSPDWVPWSERLAEYKATQAAAADAQKAAADESSADSDSDDDIDDDDEFDSAVLHGGDLDGVDIDDDDDDHIDDDYDTGAYRGGDRDGVTIDDIVDESDDDDDDDDEVDEEDDDTDDSEEDD